ncbi:response regulator [Propylenella binzhouense]|uniref:Response regulator n=1 Tax=Propylenella binzhouense TaxID=2555902 RepID=A0A964T638_9HYPH|nr:response regulator [Propylenella binzhouense]MYZ49168.1 response regulator [Propylenella binzhouense]
MRILLTEDDESVRAFVSRALELDGHKVETACDGLDALERLQENDGRYDLLVSDVKMPMMDGIALAHKAAHLWPGLPILLMTGFADQRERAEDLEQVIRDVLTKPFTLQQIREAVTEAAAPEDKAA